MINYSYQIDFTLPNNEAYSDWLSAVAIAEGYTLSEISFVFCSDEFLYNINTNYLGHDTYTDIITFDYSQEDSLHAEIYISIDRVRDNATTFNTTFLSELSRVMAHGVLHLCGYTDKTIEQQIIMREKEQFYMALFVDVP